jgi:nitroreductase
MSGERHTRPEQVWVGPDSVQLDGLPAVPPDATGFVPLAHAGDSGRPSPRNNYVADGLQGAGIGTLLFTLLAADEADDRNPRSSREGPIAKRVKPKRLVLATTVAPPATVEALQGEADDASCTSGVNSVENRLPYAATALADAGPSGRETCGLPTRMGTAAFAERLRHHPSVVACVQVVLLAASLAVCSMARAQTAAHASAVEGRNAMHEIFRKRHAVRSFQSRNVSPRDLQAILAAADSAPSAGGLKSREVLVVSDDETKRKLARAAYGQEFVGQAPVVIVFWAVPSRSAAKYGARGRDLFALQDATIAASYAWLQAVSSGLGACWVGAFDDDAVRSIFSNKIGSDWRPIALLPVGYAAE